jgi:ferredoxin
MRPAVFGCRIPRSPGSAGPVTWAGLSAPPKPRPTAGGGINLTDVLDTRPGGPNRQERAHRVGTPESLTEAIEEIGMVQVHTCVSVHCGRCGGSLGSAGFEAHYQTEDAALDAAATEGWRVGPGGRLWCSACGPVLTCEAQGQRVQRVASPGQSGRAPGGQQ